MSTENTVVSKPTKGQTFKKNFGYSKTMLRNMRKNGLATVEEYRALRKERRKIKMKAIRAHQDKIRAGKKEKKKK